MRIYLLLFVWMMIWGIATPAAEARCLDKAKRSCRKSKDRIRRKCQRLYGSSAKNKCRRELTKSKSLCNRNARRAKRRCRYRSPTSIAMQQCRLNYTRAKKVCDDTKPRISCSQSHRQCRTSCHRKCKLCTHKSIELCMNICKAKNELCEIKQKRIKKRCLQQAEYQEKDCKHRLVLRSWDRYFRCQGQVLQDKLRCQKAAKDQGASCQFLAKSSFQQCKLKNRLGNSLCLYQALLKCSKKQN